MNENAGSALAWFVGGLKKHRNALICLGIILFGIAGAVLFVKTKPEAERRKRSRMTPVVTSVAIKKADNRTAMSFTGTVEAKHSVQLKPQVSGRIVDAASEWIEGGRVVKGDVLLKLEEADYRIAVAQAQSDLALAETELALEMGRQDVAEREWELLGGKGSDTDREMVLRVPQLKSAKARHAAAIARVELAQLNLDRTHVRAPFNAVLIKKALDAGDQAAVQSLLGVLASTDSYHVRVSVPVDQLKWIVFPSKDVAGSDAEVLFPDGSRRDGVVVKLLADLSSMGSMAQILVQVDDPLEGEVAALLGSYVRVTIDGRVIESSYAISRDHYREGGEVWLLTDSGKLRVLPVLPIWSDRSSIVFSADIAEGEELITSDLNVVIDGMELRREGEQAKSQGEDRGEKRD